MRDARGAVRRNLTAAPPATPEGAVEQLSPIVRAVLDSRDEEIMLADTRGGTLYLNAAARAARPQARRSEEHTSELQSLAYLVCRLLLEKKKKKKNTRHDNNNKNKESVMEEHISLR